MGETKKAKKADSRALYRKYRSTTLDEIVGQEHITSTLKNAIKNKKLSHAYLFTGPRGVGKTSIARILAHEINEVPYLNDATHLDIIEIDAASNRRIDDIRDLREKVQLAPTSGKYKVYIIDEVHMLTAESFNALLKTLEEPPAHVIFILATTESHKLPATIISRTQRHSFKSVPKNQVVEHLAYIAKEESIAITTGALELLAEHGEGSFRDSISLLDQVSQLENEVTEAMVEELLGLTPKAALTSLLKSAGTGDSTQLIAQLEALEGSGISPNTIANQLLALLKEDAVNAKTVLLMRELLKVSSSLQPRMQLQLAMLEYCLSCSTMQETTTKPKTMPAAAPAPTLKEAKQTVDEAPPKKQEVPKKLPEDEPKTVKPNAPHEKAADKKQVTEDITDAWPHIVATAKEKNSSFYSVLRLAQPELTDKNLVLSFRFPFHQKRADESKHITLLAEIVKQHMNISPVITTKLDVKQSSKPAEPAPKAPADPATASLIASVQDIMGGGEIVNA